VLKENPARSHRPTTVSGRIADPIAAPGSVSSIPQKSPISIGVPGLWNISEVAAYLNISTRTVRRLIGKRKLSAIKLDGGWRFRPADVERFVEKRTRKAA
jgi:excisionase family DNA binding protein